MVQSAREKKKAHAAQQQAEELAKRNATDAKELETLKRKDSEGIQELVNLKRKLEHSARLQGSIELEYDPTKDPRLLTIVFSRDNLKFESGACEVNGGRLGTLRGTLQELFPEVCATVVSGYVQSIALEGHTDNQPPYGARCGTIASSQTCFSNPSAASCQRLSFENNVRLSAARAQYVFFQAREALKADATFAACLDKNFVIAGRGPMEPMDGRDWDAARSTTENERNRRVVIKVRIMAASVSRSAP
jgi:flagellar motor protein MotB